MAGSKKGGVSIEEVNRMDYGEFVSIFDSVLEHGTLAAATVWRSRPFPTSQSLHRAFEGFMDALSPEAKEGLIRCFPDLAGKLAEEGKLSGHSLEEHRLAGILDLTEAERMDMTDLNSRYKKKFSFPFVVCARENKKAAILSGLRARLESSPQEEVERALGEISKIARHRINGIICEETQKLSKI